MSYSHCKGQESRRSVLGRCHSLVPAYYWVREPLSRLKEAQASGRQVQEQVTGIECRWASEGFSGGTMSQLLFHCYNYMFTFSVYPLAIQSLHYLSSPFGSACSLFVEKPASNTPSSWSIPTLAVNFVLCDRWACKNIYALFAFLRA